MPPLVPSATEPHDAALLATIVDTAGSVIVGLTPDHRVFIWNRAAELFHQTSRELVREVDYIGTFVAPEDRARVAADLTEVMGGRHKLNCEADAVLPDGTRRTLLWNVNRVLDASGAPRGIVAVGQDITERKEAEERFRLVFEHAQDGLLISDHTGVVDCNPAALGILGLTHKSQLIGRRPSEFSPPTQPDGRSSDEKSKALGAITLSQGAHVFDWMHQKPDGTPAPVEISVRHTTLAGRRVSVVAWRDQTRRLELDRERAAVQERLDLVQKMEAVGQLAGGVAHDFNNLLAAIRNAVQLAMDDLGNGDAARADLEVALHTADRAAGLARQLLAFSRQQPRVNEVVDLAALVRDMLPMLRTAMPVSITTRLSAEVPDAWVTADRSQLEQVVLNLLINARDAISGGGQIDVVVCVDHQHRHVLLTVADSGEGMDDSTRQRIFEPFFTTKPLGAGTGLGLSVVYGVVTQAGGMVEVESAPGRGSTFTIQLPLSGPPMNETAPVVPTQSAASHGVLLVDDDAAVRGTTRRLLERRGWQVIEASNGEEALTLFNTRRDSFSIILTDVRMPVLSGVELVRQVRAIAPAFPVVFFSGYDEIEPDELDAVSNVPLLAKPFSSSDLMAVLRQAVVPVE